MFRSNSSLVCTKFQNFTCPNWNLIIKFKLHQLEIGWDILSDPNQIWWWLSSPICKVQIQTWLCILISSKRFLSFCYWWIKFWIEFCKNSKFIMSKFDFGLNILPVRKWIWSCWIVMFKFIFDGKSCPI